VQNAFVSFFGPAEKPKKKQGELHGIQKAQ